MSVPAALYYPHTNITDKSIIKNALLLWDQIEYITPSEKWKHIKFPSKYFNEAIEIVSVPHFPTNNERKIVHNRLESLISNGLPAWFFPDFKGRDRSFHPYSVYETKLDYMTWNLLKDRSLAKFNDVDGDFEMTPYFGFMLMSLLADACAGETKRKITDRADAYSWLQKYATAELGGEYVVGLDVSQIAPSYERLVTLSIKVLNTDEIPISTLVAMRKREAKSSTSDYRNFRINYLNKVDEYIERITKATIESDIKEFERQFQKDMESNIRDLKEELNLAKGKLILSREIGVAATVIAGSLTFPISGLTNLSGILKGVGVGALIKVGKEYKAARKKALRANSMSWLYLAEKRASRFNPKKILI